jgi:uncharacterized hydrophobic protein (TIGR00271 family)
MRALFFSRKNGGSAGGPEEERERKEREERKEQGPERRSSWPRGLLRAPGSWGTMWGDFVRRRSKEKQDLDVYRVLSEGARQTAEYYVLIVLSCLIATMGLIQGSVAVIIGAMIIAPLMTPILGFSLGVIWGDFRLLRIAFSSLFRGIILAVAISALLAFVVPISHFSGEIISRANPSLFDIIVALGSGALAAYGYANKKVSSALTGIAIAVALMPPLCTVGIGLGKLDPRIASEAAVLFAINLVSISLAAAVVFWLMRIHPFSEDREEVKRRALSQIVLSAALLCLITVPVALSVHTGVELEQAQRESRRFVAQYLPGSSVVSAEIRRDGSGNVLSLTVATGKDVTTDEVRALAGAIAHASPVLARAEITCLRATTASAP